MIYYNWRAGTLDALKHAWTDFFAQENADTPPTLKDGMANSGIYTDINILSLVFNSSTPLTPVLTLFTKNNVYRDWKQLVQKCSVQLGSQDVGRLLFFVGCFHNMVSIIWSLRGIKLWKQQSMDCHALLHILSCSSRGYFVWSMLHGIFNC